MIHFCTVADDRYGRKKGMYASTQKKIYERLSSMQLDIDKFTMWQWKDIQASSHYKNFKSMLDNPDPARNGRLYKPLLIKSVIEEVPMGGYVIYNDVSPEMWQNFFAIGDINDDYFSAKVLAALCDSNNGIFTLHTWYDDPPRGNWTVDLLGHHTHDNFTNESCIRIMKAEKYRHSMQHCTGLVVVKKTPDTLDFLDEWIFYNSMPECGGLGVERDPSSDFSLCPSKKLGHRHDQSVSGILINKRNGNICKKLGNRQLLPINEHNFLNFCQKNTPYHFIDSNVSPEPHKFFFRLPEGGVKTMLK